MLNAKNNMAIFIQIILIANSIILAQIRDPEGLKLKLKLEKKVYLIDEPIYYEVTEQNISGNVISTSPMLPSLESFFEIILINSKGDTLSYRGSIGFPYIDINREKKGFILKPGQKLYDVRDILGIFGNSDEAHGISYYLPPDIYTIKVNHSTNYHLLVDLLEALKYTGGNYKQAKEMVNHMEISSNVLEFEIVEPSGLEKIAYEKLINIYRIRENIIGRAPVEIIGLLNELVTDFPNSVYVKAAYIRMDYFLRPELRSKTLWDDELIITKYENSYFIYPIVKTMVSKSKITNVMDTAKYLPNTKLTEYVNYNIDKHKD